jgi:hypothetical protein
LPTKELEVLLIMNRPVLEVTLMYWMKEGKLDPLDRLAPLKLSRDAKF